MVSKPKAAPKPPAVVPSTPTTSTRPPTVPETPQPARVTADLGTAVVGDTPSRSVPETPESALGANQLLTGSNLDTAVRNIMEMGFPEDQVRAALHASFNNPDRAVEYLMTGIPPSLMAPATATPPSTAPATQSTPSNLFSAAAAAQAAPQRQGGDLSALQNNEQFRQLLQVLQHQPELLQPLLAQMGQSNPQLLEIINNNPEQFMNLLLQGEGGDDGDLMDEDDDGGDEEGEGQLPPGAQVIHVTVEEREAIERLVALGFPREVAIQAYFACDKNEELAANFLFENMGDF